MVSGNVVQARLKFEVPEVDLGLIAVGGQKDYELKFTNTAPCGVDVEFREVKDHLEAIVDDDDSVEQETAASTVADTFIIDHDTCCSGVRSTIVASSGQGPREHLRAMRGGQAAGTPAVRRGVLYNVRERRPST